MVLVNVELVVRRASSSARLGEAASALRLNPPEQEMNIFKVQSWTYFFHANAQAKK